MLEYQIKKIMSALQVQSKRDIRKGRKMKISSPRSIITFDYENGNVLKAKGRIVD